MKRLLTGNGAAAWGARLAQVDYVPAFPITPQTEIIETLASWIQRHELNAKLTMFDSEHSMITAAGAAAATGVRVFTATSSQGLLYGMEMVHAVPGWRVPFVMVNVSRGIASPLTLESDHNDILSARDSGFLQLHCSTCQEVLDNVLLAYRISEERTVRLPAFVNLDGFYLSFTREPVEIPSSLNVDKFLPEFDPGALSFRASKPVSQATAVLGGGAYSYFRYQTHLSALAALAAYERAAHDFARLFGRQYAPVQAYRNADAEYTFVMLGSFATKAMDAVDALRDAGFKVGLAKIALVRPFPTSALVENLCGKKAVAVIDQNISFGKGGILHTEVASALYGAKNAPPILAGFIGGLGGRNISAGEFFEITHVLERSYRSGKTPEIRLLYTEEELREIRILQSAAHAEASDAL